MSRKYEIPRWHVSLRMRPCFVLVLGLFFGCTAPNPDYPVPESCSPGERKCGPKSDRPHARVCAPSDDEDFAFRDELCPIGTQCASGRCAPPQGATACTRQSDCAAGTSCVPLVAGSTLSGFCVTNQPAAGLPGDACKTDDNCQSYHCLQQAAGRFCLLACGSDNHCPLATPRCQALNVTITGVQGMVGSCSPR